jgi:hypothetical protein
MLMIAYYTDETQKKYNHSLKHYATNYKLTLNDPNPISDFLGTHFSLQENG